MTAGPRRIAVLGAGVIGQVYAGRLAVAGHHVWLVARGETFTRLHADGVRLRHDGVSERADVTVVGSLAEVPAVDVAYLAVRADQVDSALPLLAEISSPVVLTLVNLGSRAPAVAQAIGAERVVLGFAGVGGTRTASGVSYHAVARQATTIGRAGGRETAVVEDLRATGLTVELVPDMEDWLVTHTVFVAGVGAAILEAGGSAALGRDRRRTGRMVLSVRSGFEALARNGIAVTPRPLRAIFTWVPQLASVPYWQRQLRGDLGRLALEPHVVATRDTEFRHLVADARAVTRSAPRLEAALVAAGFPPPA